MKACHLKSILILLIKTKRYKEAITYLNTALKSIQKIKYLKLLPVIYESLAKAQYADGQYKNAYETYNRYSDVKEKLRYERENIEELELTRIQREEQITLKEKEAIILKTQNIQKLILIFILIALLIMGYIILNIRENKKITEILNNQKQQAAKGIIDEYEKIDCWIARELHDNIGGTISAIRLKLSLTEEEARKTFIEKVKEGDSIVEVPFNQYQLSLKSLEHEIDNLENVNQSVRRLSHSLAPVMFKGQSFKNLIEDKIADLFPENYKVNIQCLPEDELNKIEENLKFNIYRILQNLSANIIIHANATKADIQVIGHKDHLNIVVEDNGDGFEKDKATDGIGLQLIKKRVFLKNGTIEINSQKGKGTTIIIEIPYKNSKI